METLPNSHSHITAQITGLMGMIRPDHQAFPLLARLAPQARFTVVVPEIRGGNAPILDWAQRNTVAADMVAQGVLRFEEGQTSPDGDEDAFVVQVSDVQGTVLVAQKFSSDRAPDAEVYSAVYAGDPGTRTAIAGRFLALLDRTAHAYKEANAQMLALAEAVF